MAITSQNVRDQVALLESQQAEAKLVMERAEGGLQVSRFWLGKLEREEAEASAATDQEAAATNRRTN